MTQTVLEARPAPGGAPPGAGAEPSLLKKLYGPVTTGLGIALAVFVAEMALVGPIEHIRGQDALYQEFRSQLANSVAPTGQVGRAEIKDGVWELDDTALVPMGAPVALMKIKELGLSEVVAQGTTSTVLRTGPGHRRDSAMPGQVGTVILMGRQATYGGPFGDIDELGPGDEITFVTGQGESRYEVTGIRRTGDKGPAPDPTKARLTLMTGDGTPFLPGDVLRVDADLMSTRSDPAASFEDDKAFASSGGPITAASLSDYEAPMSGDRSSLLPLLLWSQLLLLAAVALAWVRTVWGRWQSWVVTVPILGFVGFKVAGLVALLLPNLM